jgi:hypothetical protein
MAARRQNAGRRSGVSSDGHDGHDGPGKDLAMVFGPSEDGEGFRMMRRRAGTDVVDVGTIRPLQEGRNISGEVVSLQPRPEAPFLFDCETDRELSQPQSLSGPPQVATEGYRRGWDAIWGSRGRGRSASVN